ncbi:MAG TPA: SprT family zinc-dependent metalloprotease [Opitutaceae bacterium]|nr:SprT family zinc-dependent metalloprotease [Opitutaceae bacterium]
MAVSCAREATTGSEVVVRRSARARRYRIEVKRDGTAVLTIPARGSAREAQAFLANQAAWLARARERVARMPRPAPAWTHGTSVLFRGEWLPIEPHATRAGVVSLGGREFRVRAATSDLRLALEAQFKRIAKVELVARAWELAATHGIQIRRVSIRSQRTRWGSCSSKGTISLNWRLVQAPPAVADYVVLHELAHTRHMNHSTGFWRAVAELCPGWREAERWLKANGPALGL